MTPASTDRPLIYGAGRMGREVLAHCRAGHREPRAFVDRSARDGATLDGLPVLTPDAAAVEGDGAELLVALHSPGVDIAGLTDGLRRQRYAAVTTLWEECRRSGWLPRSPFWLAPSFDWRGEEAAIAAARGLLADDDSRTVFDQQLALRRSGDYAGLGVPTPADQYVPLGLERWRDPMRLVDCGAFDGDTLRVLADTGYSIEGFVALEPDEANFARLSARHGHDAGGRLLRIGADAEHRRLSFNAGDGSAARVDADGTTTITVAPIDDLCADFRPTLIKMDIEGAERPALDGAAATIARDAPDLAISVYHRPGDLWRIALQIDALRAGYRFHLRSHAYNGFETVLYAYAPR